MPEPIITKQCSKCKEIRHLNEFSKDKYRKDGHTCQCKICRISYAQSQKGKLATRKASQKYYRSIKGMAYHKQYRQTDSYKESVSKSIQNIKRKHPRFTIALNAVAYAIETNRLPKMSSLICCNCEMQAKHYHHIAGYDKENQLNVIPLCIKCHRKAHEIIP